MTETRKLRVFLCHSSQDKPIVRELYQRLNTEGWIDPWLDEEKLIPGQDWDFEIENSVESSDVILVCLSNGSVNKEGYIQRELKFALEVALEKPEGSIFIVPLRLEDCQIPRRLRSLQYIDYFPDNRKDISYKRLLSSFELCVQKKEINLKEAPSQFDTADSVTEEPPVLHFSEAYLHGKEKFDISFEMTTKIGEFLGECGVGFLESVNLSSPQKVIAFEVWMFDKNDIHTVTKILANSYALSLPGLVNKLAVKGQIVDAEKQRQFVLETETLIAEVTISNLQFVKNKFTNAIFFNSFNFDFRIWTK